MLAKTGKEESFIGLKNSVVFVDQLQGVDPNKITKEYGEICDEAAAKRFGARNLQEFSYWSWRSCGIANMAMILKTEKLFNGKLFDLVRECLRINGYAFLNRFGREDVGWKHKSINQIFNRYGFFAEARKKMNSTDLLNLVKEGKYVIASIKSLSGSHLILIKGYEKKENGFKFLINDPYLYKEKGGENIWLTDKELDCIFLKQAIIVWKQ